VCPGENARPDHVDVLLDRDPDDLGRRPVQARVDDLHTGISQRARDDLDATVMTVETDLAEQDPDRAAAQKTAYST
jgi:hypothetical protein